MKSTEFLESTKQLEDPTQPLINKMAYANAGKPFQKSIVMFTIAPPFSPIQDLYAAKIYWRGNSIQTGLRHESIKNAAGHMH